nr:MAG TPA: chromosome partition protein [Caudoviricetes sp.]
MKLTKLELLNFKGLKSFTINLNGDVVIRGDNATGKTTVFDSVCWLLFGKDSLDRADFEIKTLDGGEPIHKVNHEVTGTFTLDEGGTVELKRVYREKYSSPRGGEVTLTGHTTDYFVDGVPKKEKEYKEIVSSLVDESIFKLITNPLYFNETYSWQNRRKLLLEMCGDIDDISVINSRDDLRRLAELLEGRTVDDHRKVVAAKKTAINKELDMIPVRIDEAMRNKPEIASDKAKLIRDIETLSAGIDEVEKQKAIIQNGFSSTEKESKIRDIKRQLEVQSSKVLSDYHKQKQRLRDEYEASLTKLKMVEVDRDRCADRRDELNKEIERESKRIATLQSEFDTFNAQQFNKESCPTCGQALPADKQAALEAEFNTNKSKKLEEWKGLIESAVKLKENYEEQQEIMVSKIDNLTTEVSQYSDAYNVKFKEYESYSEPNLEDDPVYADLKAQLFLLEIDDEPGADTEELTKLDEELSSMKSKKAAIETELNKFKLIDDIDHRILELENQQQKLVAEKNALDEASFLMDEFIKAKVNMLEENINSRFKLARFKMFNVMLNGNVEECCETTYKGVPYRSMNNAARINVGLDIINALTSYYKVNAPVFIDNAEAVTEFVPVNSQTIKLIVDESEPQLVVKEV